MGAEAERTWTVDEYLTAERGGEVRHEFLDGELFAMSGASRAHGRLCWNLVSVLSPQLRGGACEGFANDMRLAVSESGLYTYPDLVVVCGEPEFVDDGHLDTLLNPTLIVEVLSPSTEDYDRGRKFAHYRTLETLQTYLLVAQDRVHVERFSRRPDGQWILFETDDPKATVDLPVIGARLPLVDLYDRVLG